MKGRWRQLAARPIRDRDRLRAFGVCVVILAAAAALLFSLPDQEPTPTPQLTPPTPPVSPGLGGEAGAAAGPTVPAGPGSDAERAARRFVSDYLEWVYGRGGSAARLRAASPALVARLRDDQLRIPPAARVRRPELADLDSHALGAELVVVTARVSDGSVSYAIDLTVARDGRGRWRVTRVGAE